MRFKPFGALKTFGCGWRYRRLLAAYLDDELAADTQRRVKLHLEDCTRCRAEFENMSFASQLAKKFSIEVSVPRELPQSLRNRINRKPSTNSQKQPGKRLIFVPTAALLLICFGLVAWWFYTQQRDSSWQVARLEGEPRIGSNGIENIGSLSVGQWLETDASSRARIDVADIGYLEIAANSRIGLLETGSKEHRLSLERGRIHARIWAPPRLFFVEIPSATAVDYGCEYTLEVNDSGKSLLSVTEGWVSLEFNGRQSLVPEGAFCETKPGVGPGTPYFAGASEGFRTALSRFDFEGGGASSVALIISEARSEDALTLWHLLTRVEASEREQIYERLSVLSAPPDAATREGILGLDERMLDAWREKIIVRSKNLPTAAGSLITTAKMKLRRSGHTATLLPDDRVLIAGGMIREGEFLSEAEVYDPSNGIFESTGAMSVKRVGHTATLLPNGKVLVAGGWTENRPTDSAEIYDALTGRFIPTGRMKKPRLSHRATLLPNGKVLITGGQSSESTKLASAEIYDPSNGEFSETGKMASPRMDHTATLLNNGKVLIVGGGVGRYPSETVYASAELYDPKSNTFSLTGDMKVVRFKHAAALLPDGKVLIIGGADAKVWRGRYSSAEVYDPARGTFNETKSMGAARFKNREAVIPLANGKVLVAGGGGWLEIYDPQTETFGTVSESSSVSGFYSAATLLRDGRVLLTGGIDGFSSEKATDGAWLYNP